MLLFWRKFLFYILLGAYLVLTPYAILYALGYMVSPGQGEIFNKTGLLSIESFPKGARVSIEGKKFSKKTPSAVRDLLPGDYNVEVSKKGFDRWTKKVSIYSEKATRLEPVVLLPAHAETETVSDRSYSFFLPLLIDFRVFGLSTPDLKSLKGTDIFLKRTFDAGEKAGLEGKYEVKKIYTKGNSSLVLFDVERDGKKNWEVLQLNRDEARSISGLMPNHPDLFDWDEKSPEYIYFLKDGVLNAVDWNKQKLYPVLASDVLGFGVKSGRVYVLKKDWSLWVSPMKPEALKLEAAEEPGIQRPAGAEDIKWIKIEVFKREFFQKDLMLFLSDKGMLLASRAPFLLAAKDVRDFKYAVHADEEKILFWTKREIRTVNFPKEGEEAEKNPPAVTLLSGEHKNIHQAFWAYEASHVIFRDNDELFLAEARLPEPYYVRSFMTVLDDAPVFYYDLTQDIYYLHPQTRYLTRRKVTES